MTRAEWLKSLTYGSRVRMRTPESLPGEWPATVIDVSESEVEVYSEQQGDTARFNRETGRHIDTDDDGVLHDWWRIEPLSEWRKEPPDEEGWWWAGIGLSPEAEWDVCSTYARLFDDGLKVGFGGRSIPVTDPRWEKDRVRWQKANVPAPPVEVGE